MGNRLTVYEKAMPDSLSWRERLEAAGEAGFDALELSIDESDRRLARLDWSREQRQALFILSRETGIPIQSICLSAHRKYPLGSEDDAVVRRGLEILEKAVRLSCDLGVRFIQLAGYDVYYEPSTPCTAARFADNLRRAVDTAASWGVLLGFETMETPFMNTTEKAMAYVKAVRSPYLQVYPDVGNVTNAVSDAAADLRAGEGHIFAAHLKETRPGVFRDLHFGEGHVDFGRVTAELKRQGVRLYTAEFWYHAGDDWRTELRKAHDFLRPFLKED